MLEQVDNPKDIRYVEGEFPLEYSYTMGLAGERFFRELKEKGRIYSVRCKSCNLRYVPPRIYCERCFEEPGEWSPVPEVGTVRSFAVSYYKGDHALPKPVIFALVGFGDICGGLVHRLSRVNPDQVHVGLKVKPILKNPKERTGSILDIEHFAPA